VLGFLPPLGSLLQGRDARQGLPFLIFATIVTLCACKRDRVKVMPELQKLWGLGTSAVEVQEIRRGRLRSRSQLRGDRRGRQPPRAAA
jgi:hypothetical protein